MKKINQFVDSIYSDVSGKEAEEMKEEMRTHLIETVEDLKLEGKSEKEAIEIA
ncbi:permease prefix domain 1-containing protein, partial [Priestia megaterium]